VSAYLDETYFDWLYSEISSSRSTDPRKTHRKLAHILYVKEFIWLVPNDDNRVEDGKELRYEFLEEQEIRVPKKDSQWLELGCSMLEMLVALSRRYSFEVGRPPEVLFWEMMRNLELHRFSDAALYKAEDVDHISEVLDRVIWRKYNYNGGGGLFPLIYPESDQREVELWYQLSAYILERY